MKQFAWNMGQRGSSLIQKYTKDVGGSVCRFDAKLFALQCLSPPIAELKIPRRGDAGGWCNVMACLMEVPKHSFLRAT